MPARPVRWECSPHPYAELRRLAAELGVHPVTAQVLARRGFGTPDAARRFLAAGERHQASAFDGIGTACALVLAHVERGSRIVVHGDYDVDGICSTAILVRALRRLGADVGWHLPSRDDGYGLSAATVERLAGRGTALLVTADCGITSAAEVALARSLGVDVLVTDHHRPGDPLPDCPIVHPAVCGYPFEELCAAGVAHKLAEALFERAGVDPGAAAEDLDLVALATVCDVVPLVGENRRLVREGLAALARTRKPGLLALMRVAALDPGCLDAHALGFRLGPRLNAAGRLGRPDPAFELVMTDDPDRAALVADELDGLNHERRDVETRIAFEAEALRADQDAQAAFVIAGEGWHPGVVGIVASRLVERHGRPCVLIALGPDGGRGSGRSIPAFDLHAGLGACSGLLRRHGGHRMAAGLEIDPERVPEFRRAFARHAASVLTPADLVKVHRVDAVAPVGALDLRLAEELATLGPFGERNPQPMLLVPAARVDDVRAMGEDGEHARFALAGGGRRARGVAFRTSPASLRALAGTPQEVAVRLEANEWNGAVEPRLVLQELRACSEAPCDVLDPEGEGFWAALRRELQALARDAPAAHGPGRRDPVAAHDQGFAAVAGALLAAGEDVLVACADAFRRREGIALVAGGLAGAFGARLAVVSWEALARDPGLAAPFGHVVALDPALGADALPTTLPGPPGALVHLAWGPAEEEFAAAAARAELDLRPALAELYRALRDAGGAEDDHLRRLLCGRGRHPRSPRSCARLLLVLLELELVELDAAARVASALDRPRTDLERSAVYRRACALAAAAGLAVEDRSRAAA